MKTKPPTLTQRMETVERSLGLAGLPGRSPWYKKPWMTRVTNLVLPLLAIVVSYFGIFRPEWKADAELRLKHEVKDQVEDALSEHHVDKLSSDVNTMKGQLIEISGFLKVIAAREMQSSAALSRQAFQNKLPELATTLSAAKASGAEPGTDALREIRQKLIDTDPAHAGYWAAASAFIDYRSPQVTAALPDCFAAKPTLRLSEAITATQTTIPLKESYSDCELNLVSRAPLAHRDWFSFSLMDCDRCRVVYDGTEIPLFQVGIRTLKLNDCILNVQATPKSPTSGKSLIAALLASDDQDSVSFTVSGE